jgi:hypothetical protein
VKRRARDAFAFPQHGDESIGRGIDDPVLSRGLSSG